MASPAADLYAHGHGISGYCRPCRPFFRLSMPVPVLIEARGADSPVVGMRPLTYADCSGRVTEIRVTGTAKGGG
jgi:hypothetical protein